MDRRGFLGRLAGLALFGAYTQRTHAGTALGFVARFSADLKTLLGAKSISAEDRGLRRSSIKVIGIGGAGGNIVDDMIESRVTGIGEYVYINTDARGLERRRADRKIILGTGEWQSAVGAAILARDERERISAAIANTDCLLLIAGMGGSAGTAIAPMVAQFARESGALTVALLITPFAFEGRRPLVARRGALVMQSVADWTRIHCNDSFVLPSPARTIRLQAHEMAHTAVINDARAVVAAVASYHDHRRALRRIRSQQLRENGNPRIVTS